MVALVDYDKAAAWMGVAHDANLELAIDAYSALIAEWLGRVIAATDLVETYDGPGRGRLITRNYPIISITSLSVNGQAMVARPAWGQPGYSTDGNRVIDLAGFFFNRDSGNVTLSYRAGYEIIPADLQMACMEWAKAGLLARDIDPGQQSIRAGDTEIKRVAGGGFFDSAGDGLVPMTASVYAILQNYRNMVPV